MVPLPIRIVLLRPRNPENLGAAARVMKNFGLSDWAIVDPRTLDFASARRVAVHAEEILDKPKVVASLDEAVADCAWAVGTSSRHFKGKRALDPHEVAAEARTRSPALSAIVFGDERSGLTNEDVLRCHDLSTIPTGPDQPSLNLAQSLAVYCYELFRAAAQGQPGKAKPSPKAASDAELVLVEQALRELLRERGFLSGPERHAVRDLVEPLRRSRLTAAEARLWLAALKKPAR
jgi:tRNA/rRNA methyltransferase